MARKYDGSAAGDILDALLVVSKTKSWTIAGWFKGAAQATNLWPWSAGWTGGTNPLVGISTSSGTPTPVTYFFRDDGGTNMSSQTGTLTALVDGKWHHVIMRYRADVNLVDGWLDGKIDRASVAAPASTLTVNEFTLGCIRRISASNFWTGSIAEMGIWRRGISEQEIVDLYTGLRAIQNLGADYYLPLEGDLPRSQGSVGAPIGSISGAPKPDPSDVPQIWRPPLGSKL